MSGVDTHGHHLTLWLLHQERCDLCVVHMRWLIQHTDTPAPSSGGVPKDWIAETTHSVYQRPLDCTQPGKNMDYLWGIVLLLWALGVPERGTDAQRSKNNIPRLKLSYKGQSPPAVGILERRDIKNQSEWLSRADLIGLLKFDRFSLCCRCFLV